MLVWTRIRQLSTGLAAQGRRGQILEAGLWRSRLRHPQQCPTDEEPGWSRPARPGGSSSQWTCRQAWAHACGAGRQLEGKAPERHDCLTLGVGSQRQTLRLRRPLWAVFPWFPQQWVLQCLPREGCGPWVPRQGKALGRPWVRVFWECPENGPCWAHRSTEVPLSFLDV